MMALIAGQGGLPAAVIACLPTRPFVCAMEGFAPDITPDLVVRLERLIPFLRHLTDLGLTQVCFAGAVSRPALDPALFDPATAMLVPQLLAAFGDGDDGTLRFILGLFEDHGLTVVGLDSIAPDLLPGPGVLAGSLTDALQADATRAATIVEALGAVDVGQGCVVAGGLCLSVETLPGTDAMLAQVPPQVPRRGLCYKAAKPGQDRRVDLPTVGLTTLQGVYSAGLAGLVVQAGSVVMLDRAAMVDYADEKGLLLWAR